MFELQGFLVAVIAGAVLFADRLGGSPQLARRAFQIALAFALALVVIAATTAFLRGPDLLKLGDVLPDRTSPEFLNAAHRTADISREAAMTHLGFAVLFLLAGLATIRRLGTLSVAVLIGGLLLILVDRAGGAAAFSGYGISVESLGAISAADQLRDIFYFVLAAVGAVALLVYGYYAWERPESQTVGPTPEPPPAA